MCFRNLVKTVAVVSIVRLSQKVLTNKVRALANTTYTPYSLVSDTLLRGMFYVVKAFLNTSASHTLNPQVSITFLRQRWNSQGQAAWLSLKGAAEQEQTTLHSRIQRELADVVARHFPWYLTNHGSQVKSSEAGKMETFYPSLDSSTPGTTDLSASPLCLEDHGRDPLGGWAKEDREGIWDSQNGFTKSNSWPFQWPSMMLCLHEARKGLQMSFIWTFSG